MEETKLNLNDKGHGAFIIMDGEEKLGEMVVAIAGQHLTVYHTEVAPEAEGKGLSKVLLTAMVDYAKEHQLKVVPLCSFVHAQFKRHPDMYEDVWKKDAVQ
jgi:uncharacterized protein